MTDKANALCPFNGNGDGELPAAAPDLGNNLHVSVCQV